MAELDFDKSFKSLTTVKPLSWQQRLYRHHFACQSRKNFPPIIDLPTGLGKTMVMAIWLIARATHRADVPTRLVYVVDRRTVVDQATDIAEAFSFLLSPDETAQTKEFARRRPELIGHKRKFAEVLNSLRQELGLAKKGLTVSTLRGQLADNREWSRDLSKPAIIIGTVDLIGSALLFSGYRSGFKSRPLHAGLLGQDSLLVLDEAHLSKPFVKLLGLIEQFQTSRDDTSRDRQGAVPGAKPLRVIRMSATSSTDSTAGVFRLDGDFDSRTGDFADETVRDRYKAAKTLKITTLKEETLTNRLASEADILATEKPGSRIVIFVQSPKQVADVYKALEKRNKVYATRIAQLTGTMRGLERDELVTPPTQDDQHERRVMQRFLKPDNDPSLGACFLISTSAGEVGFDLNADHLVGDAAPLDSWIQRLGRVNRRGEGDATVVLIQEAKPAEKNNFDKACKAASELLTDGMDVSPKALAAFKISLTPEQLKAALTPEPAMVPLTDILLDAWSMTSITEPMPGRPEVGPWLRGIDDELPRTTIAWRTELELVKDHPDPGKALQTVFSKHSIRPHESLTVNTRYLIDEFLKKIPKLKDRPARLMTTTVAVRLPRGKVECRTLQQLVDEPGILYAEPTLILPSAFGGLDAAGMLNAEAIPKSPSSDDPPAKNFDVADHPGYEQREEASPRLRLITQRIDGGWTSKALPGGVELPVMLWDHEDGSPKKYPTSTKLFTDLRKTKLRIRLVQPIRFDEEGVDVESLVFLTPPSNRNKNEDQSLDDHVGAVEREARRIAVALRLAEDNLNRIALLFAAKWHDEGKKADIWQRFVYGPDANGQYKGKSSKSRDPKSLHGYRHEFGSLLRIQHPDQCGTTGCELPADPDVAELALHLIATHHGMSRPHFPTAVYRDFSDDQRDALHTDAIRRFARLQKKYGWWRLAWLENLLRCADALASADSEAEDDPADAEGDGT